MKQTGTDHKRIYSLFLNVWHTASLYDFEDDGAQRGITITRAIDGLCDFLDIEFEDGEIVSIAGHSFGEPRCDAVIYGCGCRGEMSEPMPFPIVCPIHGERYVEYQIGKEVA